MKNVSYSMKNELKFSTFLNKSVAFDLRFINYFGHLINEGLKFLKSIKKDPALINCFQKTIHSIK